MSDVRTLCRCVAVGLVFVTACSTSPKSSNSAVATSAVPATAATQDSGSASVTSEPVLGADTTETTDTAETTGTTDTAAGAASPATSEAAVSTTCDALENLVADVDDEALTTLLSTVVEDNELLLPAAIQVLSDADAGSAARLLAAGRLAELVGAVECDLDDPPDRVFVDDVGVWVGSLGGPPLLVAPFGASRSAAVSPITLVFGAPIVDTGPIDPFSVYGTCGGAQLWAVEWPGLVLLFSDDGDGPELFELATWRVYRQAEATIVDERLPTTPTGLGLGSTLDEVIDVFPDGERFFDELAFGEAVSVDDQLWFIAGDGADTVTFIESGFLCGE